MKDISTIHQKRLTVTTFIVFALSILLLPSLIRPASPHKNHNKQIVKELQEKQADYIFVGNSMLGSRIEQNFFEKLTETKCHLIWHGGIMSSTWYLIIKNVVAATNIRPKSVFIFFRDTHLTEPHFRVSGKPKTFMDIYRNKNEVVLDSILMGNPDLIYRYKLFLQKLYPLLNYQQQVKRKVSYMAAQITKSIPLEVFRSFRVSKTNQLLHFENFRKVAVDGESSQHHEWNYDFDSALNNSFLPPIVEVANQNNLDLFFIRVQTRPDQSISQDKSILIDNYLSDLKAYFKHQNLHYYDFTGHPELGIGLYGSGDHLSDKGKLKFTDLFVRTILKKE